jgi:HK97 family phage major capsid protein
LSEYLKKLVEDRQSAYHAAKAKMDEAAAESRDLSGEEREFVDRTFAELDDKRAMIDTLVEAEKREREIAQSMRGLEDVVRPVEARTAAESDSDILRSILAGERRAHSFKFEKRDIAKTSSNAPVPTSFSDVVIDQARLVGPMLDPSVVTVLNTGSGEDLVLPSLATFSTAGIEAEAATIDESDPTFGRTTLKAYKYAFLVQVSQEFLADSNIDVIGFLGRQAGNEIGFRVNDRLTLGTGTVEPNGITVAAAAGVTGGTAIAGTRGTGAFTADDLIDLVYSLDGAARRLPGFGVMANGASIGAMRKLKTSSGDYVFVPTIQPGQPDQILGQALIENPAMASVGSAARSVIAGHFPSYYVRTVGGIDVARSDDFAFNTGQVTLRFQIRVDGNLPQTSHIKRFTGGVA